MILKTFYFFCSFRYTLRYNLKLLSILHVSDFCRVLMVQTFDLISMYRSVLLKLPFYKVGNGCGSMRSLHRQMVLTDLKLGKILIGIIQDRFCIILTKEL
jgi:hypothetical protein